MIFGLDIDFTCIFNFIFKVQGNTKNKLYREKGETGYLKFAAKCMNKKSYQTGNYFFFLNLASDVILTR